MKKSIHILLFWMSLIAALMFINSCYSASIENVNNNEILGEYASVSESEWHQILSLEKNGMAELRTIHWYPGEPETEKEEKHAFKWIYKPPYLELTSGDEKTILFYSKEISLLEHFDLDGYHEGLSPTKKIGERNIIYAILWKEPRTFLKELIERGLKD